jgi:hypothetical protein
MPEQVNVRSAIVSRFTRVPVVSRIRDPRRRRAVRFRLRCTESARLPAPSRAGPASGCIAIEARGKPERPLRAEGYDHFEIAETRANPYRVLSRAMLEILGPLDAVMET